MKSHTPRRKISKPASKRPAKRLTLKQLGMLNKTIREFGGCLIGLMFALLFCIVILAIVFRAIVIQPQQAISLFNTILPLVASTVSAVLGYFLGRRSQDK